MKKYFTNISTPEELKAQFRAYCVTMHPDKGGNADEFKIMVAEYKKACKDMGAWTKETTKDFAGIKRGTKIIFDGPGMVENIYVVLSAAAGNIELLRVFSDEFRSLDDVEYYCTSDWTGEIRLTFRHDEHINPLSKKFGIGYYWDDIEGKTYTEAEIAQFEHRAHTYEVWAKNWEEAEAERERIAKEEADRREAAIIGEWSKYLEEIPAAHVCTSWNELQDLPRAERLAKEKADRAQARKTDAARLAAFKRNIKAVFHRYFPGVNVTVANKSGWFCSSVITWIDGPSVHEVESVAAFDYFRAFYYDPAGVCDDYGTFCESSKLKHFRELFGSWNSDRIIYNRTLSEGATEKARQIIAENFPEFEASRVATIAEHGEKGAVWNYPEINLTNEGLLRKLLGFPAFVNSWELSDEERKKYEKASKPYSDRVQFYRKGSVGITLDYSALYKLFVEEWKEADGEANKTATSEQTDNTAKEAQTKATTAEPTDEAPAEGLELVEIPEGVAVVGDQRTTYRNRKQIKAHGAKWNKEAQQWQGTTPEAVASLRKWFGVTEDTADNTSEQEQHQEENTQEQQNTTENDYNTTTEGEAAQAVPVADLLGALVDLFGELSAAAQKCAENAKEAANRHTEAEQLRADMAAMRANIQNMGEMLRRMADRLASLERDTDGTQGDDTQGRKAPQ